MNLRNVSFAAAALATVAVASTASAQDTEISWAGEPTFGEHVVETGFMPDPMEIALTAGGEGDSSTLQTADGPCNAGSIATTPDVRVQFTAGELPLRFFVDTEGTDTTLAINAPDGEWYCVDDSVGLHPLIDFEAPESGQYDIFVGTYVADEYPEVTLKITELPEEYGPEATAP